ncbi:Tetratricopeptide-like helical [Penicillium bovifimosum]|uniref:Tetratricopeptide-like helical n=1 Tax=Penicillium bovifimosum TaxID=126998 RepID=A0A9W9KZ14_9EURO|nr:Tetratricopeptide-like helical [Penicillium bovifimosum]KAJ5129663.1 Tetratricopeptide-like helical [Penicillium bovifimosum]
MASKPESRIVRALTPKKKPNTAQAAAPQQAGQNAYTNGDLQGAIESFTQALAANDEDVGVLDNRAATYCKLKRYDLARADAWAMVELAPNEDRGYLRLAKVLCLDGNFDMARDIYEYALQQLPVNHPGREVVTQLLEKLLDKLAGGNRRDPFTVLPLEVADIILHHLSFKQIVAIMRVCKGWHGFLIGLSSLWMHVDLTEARYDVSSNTVRDYIHRSRAQLTNATIRRLLPHAIPQVIDMLSRCPKLEHLHFRAFYVPSIFYPKIQEFRQLKTLVCGPGITISHERVGSVLSALTNLEKATFYDVWDPVTGSPQPTPTWPKYLPNLKSLILKCSQNSHSIGFAYNFEDVVPGLTSSVYPNLKELRLLWNTAHSRHYEFCPVRWEPPEIPVLPVLPALRILDLRGAVLSTFFYSMLPATLETLRVDSSRLENNEFLVFDNYVPNLKTVIFNDCPWVDYDNLLLFARYSKNPLETLHINFCPSTNEYDLCWLLLRRLADLDDRTMEWVWFTFPNLGLLDLSQTQITDCTIRLFADARKDGTKGPQLDVLIIKGCDHVSRDAIDYGRQMGIEIIT